MGSAPSALSIVSVTSARPSGARPDVPAKMTSSILPPRRAFAPCSPSTQLMASTTLDFPEPFGPTTHVMPGSRRSVVAEAKDLKPFSVRLLRCTAPPPGRSRAGYRGGPTVPGTSPLDEAAEITLRVGPLLDDLPHGARGVAAAQRREKGLARGALALRDHGDPAVGQVARRPDEAELERLRPGPPAEADTLDEPLHPHVESDDLGAHSRATVPDPSGRMGRPGACHAASRSGPARPVTLMKEVSPMSVVDNAIYVDGRRKLAPASLDTAFSALRSCRQDGRSFAWIGMLRPGSDEINAVAREFDLHELAVEDTVNQHQRPKLERYGETTFVVLRPARYVDPVEVIKLGEVHLFLGPEFAITVRHADEPHLAQVRKHLEDDPELLAHGPYAVLWGVLDRVVDDYVPVLQGLQVDI